MMCLHLLLFHANNTPIQAHPFTHKITAPRIIWYLPLFSKKKLRMIPCLHKDFSEIKVLIQNKNQIGVCSNKKVLEIQVIS